MNYLTSYILKKQRALLGGMCLFVILLIAFQARTVEPAYARDSDGAPTDYELKAIYLYNFLKFVKWPENACAMHDGRSHQISVLGDSPFNQVLMSMQEKLKEKDKDLQLTFYGPYRESM